MTAPLSAAEEHHPLNAMACGSVPTSTNPGHRRPHLSQLAGHAARVGFHHIFHARMATRPATLLLQGHSSPGVYARAFPKAGLTEKHLEHFRHELREIRATPPILTPG